MTIAIGALVLALLERLERLRFRASPLWRAHAASDVIYLLTGYVAGGSLALAYIVATSHWLGRIGLPRLAAPRWASVPLALVALDLGNYAAHWLLHRVDALWEFHKAHHSSPTLDWLATFRSHLVEQTLRRLVAPALLIVAGLPPDAVVVAASLFTAWAMLNHSNLATSGSSSASWSRRHSTACTTSRARRSGTWAPCSSSGMRCAGRSYVRDPRRTASSACRARRKHILRAGSRSSSSRCVESADCRCRSAAAAALGDYRFEPRRTSVNGAEGSQLLVPETAWLARRSMAIAARRHVSCSGGG